MHLDLFKLSFWPDWEQKALRVSIMLEISFRGSSGEKGEIINKKEVKDFGTIVGDGNRLLVMVPNLFINGSRKPFHSENEDVRG